MAAKGNHLGTEMRSEFTCAKEKKTKIRFTQGFFFLTQSAIKKNRDGKSMPLWASMVTYGRWIPLQSAPGIQSYTGEVNWGQGKERKARVWWTQLSGGSTAWPYLCFPSLCSWSLQLTCSQQVQKQAGPLGAGGTGRLVSMPQLDYCNTCTKTGSGKMWKALFGNKCKCTQTVCYCH